MEEEIPQRDPSQKVLPWDRVEGYIPIKSFSGYEVKLSGWIRHDVREQRERGTEIPENKKPEQEKKLETDAHASTTTAETSNAPVDDLVGASTETNLITNESVQQNGTAPSLQ
ncbi:Ies4p KNAG_0M00900 [Huiozyma naganishii CBS 8797]|uniref:Uncharacterized protein n=1 Tax=Huiozyma naganishii (strain ATCC MYA-139 / BCRC 22969 / CBS 8797 / KCTC 17520 / NBRC 10181 / NCYC 3082 / Yp74L-3) TaxID=1071383 RepID=J7RSP6_HUIN7|nr:hypothetical protein KNAG_0M00900 [Kazachstania naganishii CBS 8797]CCK72943.1 hypothetical protein KNAG_0M00900 [Kazachstania naganishii CBS 8797]